MGRHRREKLRPSFEKSDEDMTAFRKEDALESRYGNLPMSDGIKRRKGRSKEQPLNDERLLISGAFPKITLASAYFPT